MSAWCVRTAAFAWRQGREAGIAGNYWAKRRQPCDTRAEKSRGGNWLKWRCPAGFGGQCRDSASFPKAGHHCLGSEGPPDHIKQGPSRVGVRRQGDAIVGVQDEVGTKRWGWMQAWWLQAQWRQSSEEPLRPCSSLGPNFGPFFLHYCSKILQQISLTSNAPTMLLPGHTCQGQQNDSHLL